MNRISSEKHLLDSVNDLGFKPSKLEGEGITFNFYYVSDMLANVTGGKEQTQAGWGAIRGAMDVDFGKFTADKGLTFHITGLWQFGVNLGAKVGMIANPSSLVSAHQTRLDSWWFQQTLFDNRLYFRVGQIGAQDFYGVPEYGASFVAEPIGYALGNLSSNTYESFAPAATPAAEIRIVPSKYFYIKGAIFAGNRNPYQQDTNGFHFAIRNSGVGVSEVGFSIDPSRGSDSPAMGKTYPGLYRVGAVYNGGNFTDLVTGRRVSGNYLIYFMASQAVFRPEAGSDRGLDGFFTYDWSPQDVDRVNTQTTTGLRYRGLIPRRARDTLGIGFIYSGVSDHYNESLILQGLPGLGSEKVVELNYLVQVTPWWVVQPVFQHYVNVGGNSHLGNASILGLRTIITF